MMRIKDVVQLVPFIIFKDGERIPLSSYLAVISDFEIEDELRIYEIHCSQTYLMILVKYGFLNNWIGSRQANMFSLNTEAIKEIDALIDQSKNDTLQPLTAQLNSGIVSGVSISNAPTCKNLFSTNVTLSKEEYDRLIEKSIVYDAIKHYSKDGIVAQSLEHAVANIVKNYKLLGVNYERQNEGPST